MGTLTNTQVRPTNVEPGHQKSILFIGAGKGTSGHRARALERMGHRVTLVNPRNSLPKSRVINYWNNHTGCALLGDTWARRILGRLPRRTFDLVFLEGNELVGPLLVRELKARYEKVVLFNLDDPFGGRDGRRWRLLLESLSLPDLVVVVRDCNVKEALNHGARRVIRVLMSADEVAHRQNELSAGDKKTWGSEVVFVGTWMPERGPLLAKLLELGVPLSIYGNRYDRAREWSKLRMAWRGPSLDNDDEYPKAIQSAKICLGLLSKGNRDLSTTRSFEIPLMGGLLCAERTAEHEKLYVDGEEAVFWSSPEECAERCTLLLNDEALRLRIARQGRVRCLENKSTNESTLASILDKLENGQVEGVS